jgi:hypothetical protein
LALLGTVCVSAPVDSHFGRIDVDTAIEIHLTSNLLWRPRDPDHPEDVWLRRSRHAARPGTDVFLILQRSKVWSFDERGAAPDVFRG